MKFNWALILDNALALTILAIFLGAAIGAIAKRRRRDKCLRFMDDHHVTFLSKSGIALWGDLRVYSQGLELAFDSFHTNSRGIQKGSALIYEEEMPNLFGICRVDEALTEKENKQRLKQVKRTFRPGPIRRFRRGITNLVNTFKDAFSQALNTLMDAMAKTKAGAVVGQKRGKEIGKTLLASAANAYEPLLESHIGRSVVVSIKNDTVEGAKATELPGYLVDYTDKYLAVFNASHEILSSELITVTGSEKFSQYDIHYEQGKLRINALGPDVVLVSKLVTDDHNYDLDVVLLPGSSFELSPGPKGKIALEIKLTQRIDLICPRAIAKVQFGAKGAFQKKQRFDSGLAPDEIEGAESLTESLSPEGISPQ